MCFILKQIVGNHVDLADLRKYTRGFTRLVSGYRADDVRVFDPSTKMGSQILSDNSLCRVQEIDRRQGMDNG